MNLSFDNIKIEAVSCCVPKNAIDNTFFKDIYGDNEIRKFEKTVGILSRRWAGVDLTSGDLGFKAALELIKKKGKENIKCIIFLSQTSDYQIPFTSNIIQDKLGLPREILCFDINAGCAGFIQGLSIAYSILNSLANNEKVLFIVSETLSKVISKTDKTTSMIFGDGSSAMMLSKDNNFKSKTLFNFFSDGSNYDSILIPSNKFFSENLNQSFTKDNYLTMDGQKVFDFTLKEVAASVISLLNSNSIDKENIDFFGFHQSNKFIINQIGRQLGINKNKILLNLDIYGNTSGVSIPLLLNTFRNSLLNKKTCLLSGYGSGLNWGNCIIDLSQTTFLKIHEI